MVYDRGKSHSSPSYSSSYNYTREKTLEEKQKEDRERKEHEQQREFEQQVKTASKLPPAQVKELIEGKIATKRELWYVFLDNLSSQYNSEVVAIVASAVSDDTLSFDKLIAEGIELDIAVEIYKNWNSLWGDTINQVATTSQLQKLEGELKTNSEIKAKEQTDNKSLKASKAVREPTQQQQQTYQEDSYEVAFLPAIPVAVIGGFVLVATGASLLLQVEDENGELVTVNEYASRPIAELLEAISNDIKNYYQTGDEIAQIKQWVAPALEKIVVTEEPENQVYTTPDGEQKTIEHTGSVPPEVETGTPGFDTEAGREVETQQHTGGEVSREVDWDNYIFETEEFDTEKIPGIDVPFRDYNPKHPPNWTLSEAAQNTDYKERNYDCSEIADELLKAAGGKGRIIEVTPAEGKVELKILEKSGKYKPFVYHQVYTDGRYVYDPRLNQKPIPKGDWEKLIRGTNPGAKFKYLN